MEVRSRGHSSKVKKDAASSKDAELWKELLFNAQKGTTTEPYFIAKVGQSSLHTNVFCKIVSILYIFQLCKLLINQYALSSSPCLRFFITPVEINCYLVFSCNEL